METTELRDIVEIIGTLTLTAFLFFSWRLEREERIKSQEEHKTDLRKYADLAQVIMEGGRAAARRYSSINPEADTKILPRQE